MPPDSAGSPGQDRIRGSAATEPYDGTPECPKSKRVDRPGEHSFRFDGDDPYVECVYCGEYRDALSGRVIRRGR